MKHVNTCSEQRTWSTLQDENGRTLSLKPGETVELPEPIDDPWLKPLDTARRSKRRGVERDPEPDSNVQAEHPAGDGDGNRSPEPTSDPAAGDASGKEA